MNLLTVDHGGVAEDADLGLRAVAVAQADGVVDDFRKVRVARRFAIAGEGQHVWQLSVSLHLLELLFQLFSHCLPVGHGQGRTVVVVESALAVDAVEAAHLTVGRQQVDA